MTFTVLEIVQYAVKSEGLERAMCMILERSREKEVEE